MRKIVLIAGLSLAICSFSTLLLAEDLAEALKNGEALAGKWDYQAAVSVYEKAFASNPDNFQLLWKLAYNYIKLGLMAKEDADKAAFYEKAADYANKAIAINESNVEGHVWLAVAQGRLALLKGGRIKVKLSKNVKAEAEKALQIDPDNDSALHILGAWHYQAATLPGVLKLFAKIIYGGLPPASKEEAVEYLKKAVSLNPKLIEHHLQLGKCYMAVHKWGLAKEEWAECLKLAPLDAYDKDFQAEAKALLEEYKKRK